MQKLPTAAEQTKRANELEKEAFALYGLLPYANGPAMTGVKKGLANFGPAAFGSIRKEDIGWEK
ncbi:hypothetical protein G7Y31_02160 [Corynebacterium lizhenjunii]|uniref:Uncharacterized protein n=2 Tax=Corynebacterium lizhenjunii TaxID=2709394 RepID=A0A7T0KEX0_9CORY|nr:hypothetical protein G7Y31_02160 [Corynebacterium lizhenjunii]